MRRKCASSHWEACRQGLFARQPKRRKGGLTRQDKTKVPFGDLVGRDFTAVATIG